MYQSYNSFWDVHRGYTEVKTPLRTVLQKILRWSKQITIT